MRTKIFFIVILTIIGSCSKDKVVDNSIYIETPSELIGSWNWVNTTGGIGGSYSTPQSTGETKRIEFDSNNNFKYYINDIKKAEHKFQVEKGTTITSHDSVIILRNILGVRQSLTFRTLDTIVLFDEFYDGYSYYFNRIR